MDELPKSDTSPPESEKPNVDNQSTSPEFLETSPKKNFTLKFMYLIALLTAIGVLGNGVVYYINKQTAQTNIPTFTPRPSPQPIADQLITIGYRVDYIYETGSSGAVESQQLVFVSPDGNRVLVPDNITVLINSTTRFKKTASIQGQHIKSFGMPIHPTNEDIIFLSTSSPLNETHSRVANRIYSYNLKTSELTEIFIEEAENNSPIFTDLARILRTIGIDGSKIIVLYDDPDNSPGPCTSYWYHYEDRFGYVDLLDPQGGLNSYIVPAYKIAEEKAEAEKCMLELNG